MKKVLLFAMVFGVSFLFANNVKALGWESYDYSVLGSDSVLCQAVVGCGTSQTGYPYQEINLDNDITANTISVYYGNPGGHLGAENWTLQVKSATGTILSTYLFTTSSFYGEMRLFTFLPETSSFNFIAGTDYQITISSGELGGSYPAWSWAAHTPTSTYVNTANYDKALSGAGTYEFQQDAYISINGFGLGTGDTIQWETTPSSTSDFRNWFVQLDLVNPFSSAVVEDYEIGIKWGWGDDRYLTDYKEDLAWLIDPFTMQKYVINNQVVVKPSPLPSGQSYSAQAILYNSYIHNSSTIVAVSDVWNFDVTTGTPTEYAGTNAYPGITLPDNSTSTSDFACDYAWPVNKLCEMFKYLFIPNPENWTEIYALKDTMKTKVPFGYVTVYQTSLSEMGTATSTTSTLSGQNTEFDNALVAVGDFYLVEMFRNWIFVPVLYLLVAFYIYHRFSKFNF